MKFCGCELEYKSNSVQIDRKRMRDVEKTAKHLDVFSALTIMRSTSVTWGLPPQQKEGIGGGKEDTRSKKKRWEMEENWRKQATGKR